MNPVTLYSSYVLVIITIYLFFLTRPGVTVPIRLTIPDFLFTWGPDDALKPQILDARNKNSDETSENLDKTKENTLNEDWDWTVLPPPFWMNLLTARDPEQYWLATKSNPITESSRTTKSSKPVFSAIAKHRLRKHRHRHSRKHIRHSLTNAVLPIQVQDLIPSTTSTTTTTETPIVKKRKCRQKVDIRCVTLRLCL